MEVVRTLARAFGDGGRSLYLVGGCVRDEMLSIRVSDHDLATDAEPDEVKRFVRAAGADAVYTVGERFGTIGAVFGPHRVEITTYRSESYTPGSRKPRVTFGTTLQGDLARRDFTINAMARRADGGELVDPFGGRADLAARIIRAVGNADERFAEDPLRLLRAVRFSAQFGFAIDPATRAAIARSADQLQTISAERISQEINKILLTQRPSRPISDLCQLGLMRYVVPEFLELSASPSGLGAHEPARQPRHKDAFDHTLKVLDRTPPLLTVRWGALLHDVAKPRVMSVADDEVHFYGHEIVGERIARRVLSRLKLDRAIIDRVGKIVALSGRVNSYAGDWTDGAVRRFVREAGHALEDLFLLSRSDVTSRRLERVKAAERRVEELRDRCERLQAEADMAQIKPPLDGNELMALFGRAPGPWIRPIKDRLLSMVLDGDLSPDDKEGAAEVARAMVAETGSS